MGNEINHVFVSFNIFISSVVHHTEHHQPPTIRNELHFYCWNRLDKKNAKKSFYQKIPSNSPYSVLYML